MKSEVSVPVRVRGSQVSTCASLSDACEGPKERSRSAAGSTKLQAQSVQQLRAPQHSQQQQQVQLQPLPQHLEKGPKYHSNTKQGISQHQHHQALFQEQALPSQLRQQPAVHNRNFGGVKLTLNLEKHTATLVYDRHDGRWDEDLDGLMDAFAECTRFGDALCVVFVVVVQMPGFVPHLPMATELTNFLDQEVGKLKMPVVGFAEGRIFGMSTALLLACDLVISSKPSVFLTLSGEQCMSSEQAMNLGFVGQRVEGLHGPLKECEDLQRRFDGCPRSALVNVKDAMREIRRSLRIAPAFKAAFGPNFEAQVVHEGSAGSHSASLHQQQPAPQQQQRQQAPQLQQLQLQQHQQQQRQQQMYQPPAVQPQAAAVALQPVQQGEQPQQLQSKKQKNRQLQQQLLQQQQQQEQQTQHQPPLQTMMGLQHAQPTQLSLGMCDTFGTSSADSQQDSARGALSSSSEPEDPAGATSFMICNIPCRISQRQVVAAVDALGFAGKYDCIYTPRARGGSSPSIGYAFINLLSPEDGQAFINAMTGYQFEGTYSAKRCAVKPARIQGLGGAGEHLPNNRLRRNCWNPPLANAGSTSP